MPSSFDQTRYAHVESETDEEDDGSETLEARSNGLFDIDLAWEDEDSDCGVGLVDSYPNQ